MSGRIEYPNIPRGTVPEQLRSELRKLVDQMNMELSELEQRIEARDSKQ